jgi:hypothetical protein
MSYPLAVSYTEALRFATYCGVTDAFLLEYGSELSWIDCHIDVGELMAFVEDQMAVS